MGVAAVTGATTSWLLNWIWERWRVHLLRQRSRPTQEQREQEQAALDEFHRDTKTLAGVQAARPRRRCYCLDPMCPDFAAGIEWRTSEPPPSGPERCSWCDVYGWIPQGFRPMVTWQHRDDCPTRSGKMRLGV